MERKEKKGISAETFAAIALIAGLFISLAACLIARPTLRKTVYVLVSEKQFDGDGTLVYSAEYEYDGHGRELCRKSFDDRPFYAQNKHSRKEYTYDEKGNMLTETGFGGDRLVYFMREYEYMAVRVG